MNEDPLKEYKDAVLREFQNIHDHIEKVSYKLDHLKDTDISDMKVEIALLKLKAGLWGLLGGIIPVAIMLVVTLFKNKL